MRQILAATLVILCSMAGCGGNADKPSAGFPHNKQFKDLQAMLTTSKSTTKSVAPPRRDETYLLRTPHEDWTMSEAATYALVRIGKPAVAKLLAELKHDQVERQLRAIDILARIGPDAADAVPELKRMLGATDIRVRKYAARALGQIGPAAADAVSDLIRALNE